jgi:hypothetical protein
MKALQLTKFAKARVHWQPRPALMFEAEGVLTGETTASGPPRLKGFVTIEALVPRGARADYGLLGVAFDPGGAGHLRAAVRYCSADGVRWTESLATSIDDVRIGLPKEYSDASLEGILSGLRQPPPGSLSIAEAAHGLVGSSAAFFRRLGCVAGQLVFLDESEIVADTLAARLRALLAA